MYNNLSFLNFLTDQSRATDVEQNYICMSIFLKYNYHSCYCWKCVHIFYYFCIYYYSPLTKRTEAIVFYPPGDVCTDSVLLIWLLWLVFLRVLCQWFSLFTRFPLFLYDMYITEMYIWHQPSSFNSAGSTAVCSSVLSAMDPLQGRPWHGLHLNSLKWHLLLVSSFAFFSLIWKRRWWWLPDRSLYFRLASSCDRKLL